MAISINIHNTTVHVGDTVSVHYRIIEKEVVSGKTKKEKHEEQKERTQAFSGVVIAIRGKSEGKSFIVRHMGAGNIGVERIFPVISPWIKKIVVTKKGNPARAKLYYLRDKSKKEIARMTEKNEISSDSLQKDPPAQKTQHPISTTDSNAPTQST